MLSNLAVVLLCGGSGSKLGGLVDREHPKSGLPLANMSLFSLQLSTLSKFPFHTVHVILRDQIDVEFVENVAKDFPNIHLVPWFDKEHEGEGKEKVRERDSEDEGKVSNTVNESERSSEGTAGALLSLFLKENVTGDDILVISGDTLVPYQALMALCEDYFTNNTAAQILLAKKDHV
jgi:NDP-sugar pyrophosphorylase family protein